MSSERRRSRGCSSSSRRRRARARRPWRTASARPTPTRCSPCPATTRAPRGAERDGVDYHFVAAERFAQLVAEGAFAEWAEVHGQRYGTLRATVEQALARRAHRALRHRRAGRGADQGGLARATRRPCSSCRPRWPSSSGACAGARRTVTRSSPRRLAAARAEVARGLATYDYVIVNDALDAARVASRRSRRTSARGAVDASIPRRPGRPRRAFGPRWTCAPGSRERGILRGFAAPAAGEPLERAGPGGRATARPAGNLHDSGQVERWRAGLESLPRPLDTADGAR